MGIENKTVGMIIDELITTDLKLWYKQETVMNPNSTKEEVADAAIEAQKLNKRRNALIQAIDRLIGNSEFTTTNKTY